MLVGLGVRPGDRVAVVSENRIEGPIARLGIWRAGAAEVPVNPMFRRSELEHLLTDAAVRAVFFSTSSAGTLAEAPLLKGPDRPKLVCLDGDHALADMTLGDAMSQFPDDVTVDRSVDARDLAFVSYTSGTTGFPKGAMISHHNFSVPMDVSASTLGLGEDDVVLQPSPMFHSNSSLWGYLLGLYIGGLSVTTGRFSAELIADVVAEYKVSCGMVVPTMLYELNKLSEERAVDFSSLRYLGFGASPTPPAVRAVFEANHPQLRFFHAYGMTEAPGPVSWDPVGESPRTHTVGRPLVHLSVRIVDDLNQDVATGEVGEITLGPADSGPYAKAYEPMAGYWGLPEVSAAALAGGVFHTGDLGRLDEEGFLEIVDRKKDVIIASGFNIYPAELERVLAAHPAIAEAYVVGIPHERRVEAPKAFVVLTPGATLSPEEIKAYIRGELAPFKALAEAVVVDREDLPRNALGKVLKRQLH